MGRYRGSRVTKLSRETVIRAALDLLNEVGVDGLSTRRLAERAWAAAPLYWHFKNKRELLDALSRQMLVERHTRGIPQPGEHWRAFLHDNAMSFRRGLLAYRDGARIHAGTRPDGPQAGAVERSCACCGRRVRAGRQRACAAGGQPVHGGRGAGAAGGAGRRGAGHDPAGPAAGRAAARRHGYTRRRRPGPAFEQGLALLLDGWPAAWSRAARARLLAGTPRETRNDRPRHAAYLSRRADRLRADSRPRRAADAGAGCHLGHARGHGDRTWHRGRRPDPYLHGGAGAVGHPDDVRFPVQRGRVRRRGLSGLPGRARLPRTGRPPRPGAGRARRRAHGIPAGDPGRGAEPQVGAVLPGLPAAVRASAERSRGLAAWPRWACCSC